METTAIYLTNEEIEQFKLFRQYQDVFNVLIAANVFNISNGNATLSFNNSGLLVDVEIRYKAYHVSKLDSIAVAIVK